MNEDEKWVTIKGNKILIKSGQTIKEAFNDFLKAAKTLNMEVKDDYHDIDKLWEKEDKLADTIKDNLETEGLNAKNYLNRGERVAIQKYTNSSSEYNNYLRNNGKGNENFNEVIFNLDNAIKKFELKNNLIVHRIADDNWLNIKNKNEGDIVSDKGYTSTTITKNKFSKIKENGGVHGDMEYEIYIPKGKGKGFYTPYQSHFGFEEEEFLIPRNQKFRILEKNDKKVILEAVYDLFK